MLWERQNQCKTCSFECGFDETIEADGKKSSFCEHRYECSIGENCENDFKCEKYIGGEEC